MTVPQKVHGIDISHHQDGPIDFGAAKERGLRWLYHKATEGTSFVDENYDRRREQARKAGLPFGAYHFARPETGDAKEEAFFFLRHAKPRPGDLRATLDLETKEGLTLVELRTWAARWCEVVEKETGVQPIIYTPFDLGPVEQGKIIWRPRYNNSNTPPVLPWDIWQFSNGVYGVPNLYAGFGHVDLNVMRTGLETKDLRIPVPKKTRRLRVAVAPMEFKDSDTQTRMDFRKILGRGFDVVTGTEVGKGSNSLPILKEVAKDLGYRVQAEHPYDTWVAIKEDLIGKGSWAAGAMPALPSSDNTFPKPPGRWGPKAVVWAECEIDGLGVCAFGAIHYVTHRSSGDQKQRLDRQYEDAIQQWVREHGKGRALAFVGGDFNKDDKKHDYVEGMISAWDEAKEWDGTHGPNQTIDAVLRSQADARVVRWVRAEALDDKDLPLHTDHYLTTAVVEIHTL